MLIIGELINCTRKRVAEAAQKRDAEFFRALARQQVEAGAHLLDVNGGLPGQEAECLCWLVEVVQDTVDVPLCLDSSDPEALRRALPLCKRRAMINSITDEPARYAGTLPLLKEFGAQVIALCMSEAGPPAGVDDRMATAGRLVERLTADGIALADLYIDPCIFPVASTAGQGMAALEAVTEIRARYPGVHTSAGVSNVSFGLPQRKLLNEVFLLLLMARGLDAAIVDPTDHQLMINIKAAEALLGRDEYCAEYIRAYRAGKMVSPAA
jgi:5-methyltetrahydrofolate--homocysteine methyltransferase